jgi:hypothetical protein
MRTCSNCHRHVRSDTDTCPFCRAAIVLAATIVSAGVVAGVVAGAARLHHERSASVATVYGGPPVMAPEQQMELGLSECAAKQWHDCAVDMATARQHDDLTDWDRNPRVRAAQAQVEKAGLDARDDGLAKCAAHEWEPCRTLLNHAEDMNETVYKDPRVIAARKRLDAER